jgi:hypothetical protein
MLGISMPPTVSGDGSLAAAIIATVAVVAVAVWIWIASAKPGRVVHPTGVTRLRPAAVH